MRDYGLLSICVPYKMCCKCVWLFASSLHIHLNSWTIRQDDVWEQTTRPPKPELGARTDFFLGIRTYLLRSTEQPSQWSDFKLFGGTRSRTIRFEGGFDCRVPSVFVLSQASMLLLIVWGAVENGYDIVFYCSLCWSAGKLESWTFVLQLHSTQF